MEATMHEAKTNLSKLVARVRAGEEVILTSGRNRVPMVRMVPMEAVDEQVVHKRPLGFFKDEMGPISDYNWDEPMSEEELALWYDAPIVSTWADSEGTPKDEK